MSETLLSELYPFGINVSVVCLVSFPSNLLKTIRNNSDGGVNTAKKLMAKSLVSTDILRAWFMMVLVREGILLYRLVAKKYCGGLNVTFQVYNHVYTEAGS